MGCTGHACARRRRIKRRPASLFTSKAAEQFGKRRKSIARRVEQRLEQMRDRMLEAVACQPSAISALSCGQIEPS